MRGFSSAQGAFTHGDLHFPVLSVPVGQADELACPDEHTAFLKEKLAATESVHLLLIGYSGNDREVVSLIREAANGVHSLTIVDRSFEDAEQVAGRLQADHGLVAQTGEAVRADFNSWVEGGGVAEFVRRLSAEPS